MPPRDLQERTRRFANVYEESDECVDCLEALRDTNIKRNDELIREARELASIFAASVKTARKNSRRGKDFPDS